MTAPVIGITSYLEPATWGARERLAALLPAAYVTAVAQAGGRPVLLPPVTTDTDVLDRLDGVVLAGGGDIDPARYGADPHPRTGDIRPDRDSSEFALVEEALRRQMPTLGICRGMQVLTVATGGRLHQHLDDVVDGAVHRGAPGTPVEHAVRMTAGTRLQTILGDEAQVPSYHHQGVADVDGRLRVAATAPDDTVEAVEAPDLPFFLGVLWHPEVGADPRLLTAFVEAARDYAGFGRP